LNAFEDQHNVKNPKSKNGLSLYKL
jgi:hypothetical protein